MSIKKGTTHIAGNVLLDATPTQNSTRGVTSGGVYSALGEVIYDKVTHSIFGGTDYSAGIPNDTVISNIDLTSYKSLKCYCLYYNVSGMIEVNLNSSLYGAGVYNYGCSNVIYTDPTISILVQVPSAKTSLRLSTNNSIVKLVRIEGVK